MLQDYRRPLQTVKKHLAKKTDLKTINKEIKSMDFKIDYSWAIRGRDKDMGQLAKKFFKSNPKIIGTDKEFNEFILRYLLSIWLIDWEGPLYALLLSTKNNIINLKELNDILALWDFTEIFTSY